MDSNIYKLFKKDEIEKIGKKIKPMLLNSATKGKSNFTRFEMLTCKNDSDIRHEMISIYDIFVSEEKWNNAQTLFMQLDQKTIDSTIFEYKNMKLIRNENDAGLTICEKFVEDEQHLGYGYLSLLSEVKLVDVADFSCRQDITKGRVREIRIKICEKAPIYLSFFNYKMYNKFFYKLWFEIRDDIDDVLDNLLK